MTIFECGLRIADLKAATYSNPKSEIRNKLGRTRKTGWAILSGRTSGSDASMEPAMQQAADVSRGFSRLANNGKAVSNRQSTKD